MLSYLVPREWKNIWGWNPCLEGEVVQRKELLHSSLVKEEVCISRSVSIMPFVGYLLTRLSFVFT